MTSNTSSNIFEYEDYRDYLGSLLLSFPGRKRPLSRAQLSKILGYRSPRLVSMVIQGARVPSREFLLKLAQKAEFSAVEFQYFELLVLKSVQQKKGKPIIDIEQRLSILRGRACRTRKMDFQDFAHIAEWHYMPILALISSPGFQESPEWIARKLRGKITPEQARKSLERMMDLGVLERDPATGRLKYAGFDHLYASSDVPSKAALSHHQQMLERASESLVECFRNFREFQTFSMRFSPAHMNIAREMIREFFQEFVKKMPFEEGGEVYQFGIYFYPHTDLKS